MFLKIYEYMRFRCKGIICVVCFFFILFVKVKLCEFVLDFFCRIFFWILFLRLVD